MTAQEIINGAMRLNKTLGSGDTPSTEESNDGLVALNAMIANWNEALKLALAGSYASAVYTFVALPEFGNLSTSCTLPNGWLRAFRFNLAVELAAEYGQPIDPGIAALAVQSKAAVMAGPVAK